MTDWIMPVAFTVACALTVLGFWLDKRDHEKRKGRP